MKLQYFINFGVRLNLKSPKTFNEKLQWLKLYNRRDIYTVMVDKYAVKGFVEKAFECCAEKPLIIPTLGLYNTFEEIDFAVLPPQYVLKCTHDSGSVIICKDKEGFSKERARRKLNKMLRRKHWRIGREWAYKNVKPRIIAEKYISQLDIAGGDLLDYKIFTFDGKAKFIQVDLDRFTGHKRNLYDTEWNLLDFKLIYENGSPVPKPAMLEKMLKWAEMLAVDMPFLRVDFYCVDNDVYFGEMTLYPENASGHFMPDKYDLLLGEMIRL